MRPRLIAAVACALVIAGASAVSAQYETSDRSPIGIRVAVYRPSDSLLSDLGSAWLGPVVDYNWRFDRRDRPEVKISLGWYGEDKGVDKGSYLPLTATYIKRYYREDQDTCWFVGGGVGAYFVDYRHIVWFDSVRYGVVKDKSTEVGLNIVGGYERGPWFAELRYDLMSSLGLTGGDSVDFSGFTLSVGTNMAF